MEDKGRKSDVAFYSSRTCSILCRLTEDDVSIFQLHINGNQDMMAIRIQNRQESIDQICLPKLYANYAKSKFVQDSHLF